MNGHAAFAPSSLRQARLVDRKLLRVVELVAKIDGRPDFIRPEAFPEKKDLRTPAVASSRRRARLGTSARSCIPLPWP